MKKILFILFLITTLSNSAQDSSGIENSKANSYIGWITKTVNFRVGPSKEFSIIKSLERGNEIFIISDLPENSYYNIIDIESNKEGYVHMAFVEFGDKIEKSKGEMFTSKGATNKYETQIEIYNNTNKTLTLKLNTNKFKFSPQEKRTISMKPGEVNYIASAPNVIPLNGSKNFEGYNVYTWQFYIQQQNGSQINIEKIKAPVPYKPPPYFKIQRRKLSKEDVIKLRAAYDAPLEIKIPEIPKFEYDLKLPNVPPPPLPEIKVDGELLARNVSKIVKNAYYSDGNVKSKLKDYYGAISDYNKALGMESIWNKLSYKNRGVAKENIGDLKGACSDWQKAANLGDEDAKRWVEKQCK